MNSKEYVLNYDFGYGREPELDILNKLELRNINDLKVYVNDCLANAFINYQNNLVVSFKDQSIKISIEKL